MFTCRTYSVTRAATLAKCLLGLGIFFPILNGCGSSTPFATPVGLLDFQSSSGKDHAPPNIIGGDMGPPQAAPVQESPRVENATPPAGSARNNPDAAKTPSGKTKLKAKPGASSPKAPAADTTRYFIPKAAPPTGRLNAYPWVADKGSIAAIFPQFAKKGTTYLSRSGTTFAFQGGPHNGEAFTLSKPIPGAAYARLASANGGRASIEIGIQEWKTGIPLLKPIRGRYIATSEPGPRPEEFILLMWNGEKPEQFKQKKTDVPWEEFTNSKWTVAYLLTQNFEKFADDYRFADVGFGNDSDGRYFGLQRFGSKPEPWIRVPIGSPIEPAATVTRTSSDTARTFELIPVKKDGELYLVGIISLKNGAQTWFLVLPRASSVGA